MAKKRSVKKVAKKESCTMDGHCTCKIISMKLTIIAFVLLLIRVWEGFHDLVMRIHWGWYLAIMLIFCILAAVNKNCWCCKK